jgi:hypothetical protein
MPLNIKTLEHKARKIRDVIPPPPNKQNKAKQNKTIVSNKHVQQLNRSGRCYGLLDLI